MRISIEGELIWDRIYESGEYGYAIIELKDGRFAMCGQSRDSAGIIYIIDEDGEEVWHATYDANHIGHFLGIRETDGGLVAAGYRQAQEIGLALAMWAVRVDFEGNVVWNTLHGINGRTSLCYGITSSEEGGFLLSGKINLGPTARALAVAKISAEGGVEWDRDYELPQPRNGFMAGMLYAFNHTRMPDGGYAICATQGSDNRPFVTRITAQGQVRWQNVIAFNDRDFTPQNVNFLRSIIVNDEGALIAAGALTQFSENPPDTNTSAVVIRIEPEQDAPIVIEHEPQDSVLFVLTGDSIRFRVVARDQWRREIFYTWRLDDQRVGSDTAITITFPEQGTYRVRCEIRNDEFATAVLWRVETTDLFIASHTPDTLSLTLQRNSEIDFALDSVAYIGDLENLRYEWMIYDSAAVRWGEVGGDDRIGIRSYAFDRTGGYALKAKVFDLNVDPVPADSVQWAIQVRGVIRAFEPNLAEISLEPRQETTFELIPFNANNDSIQFWWMLNEADTMSIESTLSISFQDTGRYIVSGYAREQVGEEAWEEDVQRWAVNVGMLSVDDFGLDSGFRRNDDPLMISI
ncbi:MAG: hypothetical protein FJY67_07115, partial [Calditrichaeota bacterium]|nr:hypothetical protein [Calditrichota bacterium]